jgi:excinuclease ABC subunit C
MFDIKEALKNLPDKPGVYLMKDEFDHVIYVGKAKILKNRVRQYFHHSANHTNKIMRMVALIKSFEYIVTDSELEALILECNLIKKYWPKYNTMLKDDKTYPYIKITVGESFPRIMLVREVKKDKAKYFGPYASAYSAKETIDLVRKMYKIRTCHRVLPRDIGKERPCLNYHIKQCDAPCMGYINKEDYKLKIDEVVDFLGGNYVPVIRILEQKMMAYSEELDFEKAAEYRDYIKAVKTIMERQKIVKAANEDQDIIAFAANEIDALIQVYFVRNGKLIGREHFRMEHIEDQSKAEIMTAFVKQFYSGTPFIPKELILQEHLTEAKIIENWLSDKRGQKVYIKVPQKGEKNKLVELAAKNAVITLEQFGESIKKEEERTTGAMQELVEAIGLKSEAKRIEAYDISTHQGVATVGSMVVFEDGTPKKSDYRKFKVKYGMGPDDYASMNEVLSRRFTHALEEQKELLLKGLASDEGKFSRLPDLILMDGGKGQVNIALQVLREVGLDIPVCGMVKDDKHQTRGLYYNNKEIPLSIRSEAFKLVARIQDEAHRFAIDFHRKTHKKEQINSVLDDISGIGPTRRKNLMRAFGSIEQIKLASAEELGEVQGMNQSVSQLVYDYFHKKEN